MVSKLRWYSMGIVAENKPLKSMDVQVVPVEEYTMLDGEVNTQQNDYSGKGVDNLGQSYEAKVKTTNSIPASWLRFGDANRMTAPDVRRGEAVMIYQFGDSPKFYWMTIKQDALLRRLETVVYAFSASAVEGDPMDPDHTYYIEISTHKGLVHFHTSQANGEPFAYDFQFNTKEGVVNLKDSAGNYLVMNSTERRFEMYNTDGSHWDMEKSNLTVTIPEEVRYKVGKHFWVHSPKITLDGVTNVTKDTTMEMNTTTYLNTMILGGLGVTQQNGTLPGGKNRMKGDFELEGSIDILHNLTVRENTQFYGPVQMYTTLYVSGYATLAGGHSD